MKAEKQKSAELHEDDEDNDDHEDSAKGSAKR